MSRKEPNCDDKLGKTPLIWLLENLSYWHSKVKFQNQSGRISEMSELKRSNSVKWFWVWSHLGKGGPNLQEANSREPRWNGGTHSKLMLKVRELEDKPKYAKLDRLKRWASEMVPCNNFEPISNQTSSANYPILLGKVPFSWL